MTQITLNVDDVEIYMRHIAKPRVMYKQLMKLLESNGFSVACDTIVEADSMDAALEMARACPFLEIDGTLEVSELMAMPGAS